VWGSVCLWAFARVCVCVVEWVVVLRCVLSVCVCLCVCGVECVFYGFGCVIV